MKKFARSIVVAILGWQVRRLRAKHTFKVVGVVGSIGKTSTKMAIANVLSSKYKVRYQEGNYNDLVTVPLIFFGQSLPSLLNPFAWLKVFVSNEVQLNRKYPFDIVVVEVGTDGPGQIAMYEQYLHCDIVVVTAITPEHMEYFDDMEAVAVEEFSAQVYADSLIVNADLCDETYRSHIHKPTIFFGKDDGEVRITELNFHAKGADFKIKQNNKVWLEPVMDAVGIGEVYSATAAAIVAEQLGLHKPEILEAIAALQPVAGRMQRLKGIKDSLILDETYNASPVAMKAALDSLYMLEAPQKIAILGNMNELGDFSKEAHTEIGNYCEPTQLDWVITIGPDANKYLALAAEKAGCKVKTFNNPYDAADFIKKHLKPGAIILAKGSQNGVYAEEAVKKLLANSADANRLVRQSPDWLAKKHKNFI